MAYTKYIFKTIKNNLYRFILLIAITFVGITFISGVTGVSEKVRESLSLEMNNFNSADLILKNNATSFNDLGFDDETKEEIEKDDAIMDYAFFTSFETTHKKLENFAYTISPGVYADLVNYDIAFNIKSSNEEKEVITRYYAYPFEKEINKLELIEGAYPKNDNECVVEQASLTIHEYHINDTISLNYELKGTLLSQELSINNKVKNSMDNTYKTREYKIVGIVKNPLFFTNDGEEKLPDDANSTTSTGINLECIMYAKSNDNPFPCCFSMTTKTSIPITSTYNFDFISNFLGGLIPSTDCFITFKDCDTLKPFSSEYRKKIDSHIAAMKLKTKLSEDKVTYIDYSKMKSYMIAYQITDKVDIITNIFPVLFLLVVLLVTGNNLTKMISDDRKSIGTMKSLGYNNRQIIAKYSVFAFFSIIIGCIAGLLVGMYTLPIIFLPAFKTMIFINTISSSVNYLIGLLSSFAVILLTQGLTICIANKNLKNTPSMLMVDKAPKAGKKILLEKNQTLWNKLKFKTKSCFRNIFRYKLRLIMMVFSTALSSALVMAGFGLLDVSKNGISISSGFVLKSSNTILYVSIVILLFAMLLSILVLYNIINMNIDERKKEIATLKVLGYKNSEVYSYIFKDVVIMAIFGILCGLPIGIVFLVFIFKLLSFGGIANVNWYSYIFTFALSLSFIFIVFLMMIKKMKNINMADSLQSRE